MLFVSRSRATAIRFEPLVPRAISSRILIQEGVGCQPSRLSRQAQSVRGAQDVPALPSASTSRPLRRSARALSTQRRRTYVTPNAMGLLMSTPLARSERIAISASCTASSSQSRCDRGPPHVLVMMSHRSDSQSIVILHPLLDGECLGYVRSGWHPSGSPLSPGGDASRSPWSGQHCLGPIVCTRDLRVSVLSRLAAIRPRAIRVLI